MILKAKKVNVWKYNIEQEHTELQLSSDNKIYSSISSICYYNYNYYINFHPVFICNNKQTSASIFVQ